MKKNVIYIATGIVFLIFAVCIAYVFTEPSQTPQKQEAALLEQDASQLTALNTEKQKTPSADALTFTAQENSQTITTPPPAEATEETTGVSGSAIEEKTNADISSAASENNTKFTHPAQKTETKKSEPPAYLKDKMTQPAAATAPAQKKEAAAAPETAPAAPEKTVSKPKAPLQDKLPVAFVEDSLKTRTILDPKKNADTIIYSELMMDGNQVGFVFEGDKPISPKTFRLTNPDRVVLDIEGCWILKTPQLISNRMVKDIRSNSQKEKTRIVFDLKVPANSSMLYRIHNRKYQLVFK